jgi:hypothetical protein
MTDVQPASGKKTGKLVAYGASILAAIGVIAALMNNITSIMQFVEPILGWHTPSPAPVAPTPAPVAATPAPVTVKVCMGNGGGQNCLDGAGAKYDCNAYNAMGGGAQKTYDALADMFCGYTENGVRKVAPHNIVVVQNNGGGQCGWTAFQVTCNH